MFFTVFKSKQMQSRTEIFCTYQESIAFNVPKLSKDAAVYIVDPECAGMEADTSDEIPDLWHLLLFLYLVFRKLKTYGVVAEGVL